MTSYKAALLPLAAALALAASPSWAADLSSPCGYIGGTLADTAKNSSGSISTASEDVFQFETKNGSIKVPYQKINLIEYGQKVGRNAASYALAIGVSPLFLLVKSRSHYVTVGYSDENGKQQAAVFQVDKKAIRPLLASLEARTGVKVTFQDQEARKAGKG